MTKYFLFLLLPIMALSDTIQLEHTQLKPIGKTLYTNAQITQLSAQKQIIVSRLSGHLEQYYIRPAQKVKEGDKIVLIESIKLSKMTANYLALKRQVTASRSQKKITQRLYKKGLISKNSLNSSIIALEKILSKKNVLASQLTSLGIHTKKLTKATDKFILYAHEKGTVGKILVPLHSNVNAQTPIVTLVNQSGGYYATAYLSIDDAMLVSNATMGFIEIAKQTYKTTFIQLLPHIDVETQRAKVLFKINNNPFTLLLGAYVPMKIVLAPTSKAMMIKKTALTLFKGEWVVFVPKEEEAHEEHHEGEEEEDEHHDNEEEHEDHDEHQEIPYEAKIVEIIDYIGDEVAIKGLEKNEEYVSNGVYYVKSMLLKSALGGHGH